MCGRRPNLYGHSARAAPLWLNTGLEGVAELLVPTDADEEARVLFEEMDAAIGGCVEVLEAERLPKMDISGSTDPYALLIFESTAAPHAAWRASRSPKWPGDAPRAFRFPVRSPYSCVYVGMKDSTTRTPTTTSVASSSSLDPSRTVYYVWLLLQRRNYMPPGLKGAIRLRYSVVFYSDRVRLTKYLLPTSSATTFYVPFVSEEAMRDALSLGRMPDVEYNRKC